MVFKLCFYGKYNLYSRYNKYKNSILKEYSNF